HGRPLPAAFDDLARRGLEDWFTSIASAAPQIEISAQAAGRQWDLPRIDARGARDTVANATTPAAGTVPAPTSSAEGTLYMVNLHSGRYAIEDDLGRSIALETSIFTGDSIAPLLGQRVLAEGTARFDNSGRLQAIDVTRLVAAPEIEGLDRESFWRAA